MADYKPKVFISYSPADKPSVRKFYQTLKTVEGIDPWLDEERILPGQDWGLELEKAIKGSDILIVMLSKNSLNETGDVQKELSKALELAQESEGNKFIIPVLLDDSPLPKSLIGYQYIDFSRNTDLAETLFRNVLNKKVESRLAGDTTTDAPPPKKKKDK